MPSFLRNPAIGGALTEHKSFSGGAGWWPLCGSTRVAACGAIGRRSIGGANANILSERVAELQKQTAGLGLTVREDGQHVLSGQAEKIRAKWWLGGRKVDYRMSCRAE